MRQAEDGLDTIKLPMRTMQKEMERIDKMMLQADPSYRRLLRAVRRTIRQNYVLMFCRDLMASSDPRGFKRRVKSETGIDLTREMRRILQSCGVRGVLQSLGVRRILRSYGVRRTAAKAF